jgi:hypothetical protein
MKKLLDVDTYYPDWICNDCGKKHGRQPSGNPYGATYHEDQCGVCFQIKEVTEPRDFSHLKPSYKNDVKKFWK